jgi:hypothetical protein
VLVLVADAVVVSDDLTIYTTRSLPSGRAGGRAVHPISRRHEYGGLLVAQAGRLKDLERENARSATSRRRSHSHLDEMYESVSEPAYKPPVPRWKVSLSETSRSICYWC